MGSRERKATQALIAGKRPVNPVVITARTPDRLAPRLFGLGLAGMGAAHFTAPATFDPITEKAFPHNTRRWTYRNGLSELLIGLSLSARRTRPLGTAALIAYAAFLATKATTR